MKMIVQTMVEYLHLPQGVHFLKNLGLNHQVLAKERNQRLDQPQPRLQLSCDCCKKYALRYNMPKETYFIILHNGL